MRNAQMLKTCWLLPMLIIAGTFAVHMINLSHDITKKKTVSATIDGTTTYTNSVLEQDYQKKKKMFHVSF